jgi:uncharacterized protein YbjT (DUF2867 family)
MVDGMKIVLFGASGMVGQGVLRECLLDPDVTEVVSVVRTPTGSGDPKLTEVVHGDFTDFGSITPDFAGADACFFCLGVSAGGMKEDAYRRISYDITLAAAEPMITQDPALTFLYVSGAGTNANGRAMWARVKGETENALLALSDHTYMFRPGFIRPMHGVRSKTPSYRAIYAVTKPFGPVMMRLPVVTDTERVGRAMLSVARNGYPRRILENKDINVASKD